MRKITVLIALLFLSTSFKPEPKLTWLGTFDMYLNEDGNLVVYYKGDIPQCLGKRVIDFVYIDCDTVTYSKEEIQKSLHIEIEEPDSCKVDPILKKITRI